MSNKVTKKAIASVEKLLQTTPPENIVNNPELQRPLIHALYKTNSCGAIADLFTSCGAKVSRQHIHKLLQETPHLAVKQSNNHRYPSKAIAPEKEAEVLRLFDEGCVIQDIAKALNLGNKRISEIVEGSGKKFGDRHLNRKVKIGDLFGNWELIAYAHKGHSLCRDVRNGLEKAVPDANLYNGVSTGCRELAIAQRSPTKANH
jgi:DNA-binding NarL/FixJ family response regulator